MEQDTSRREFIRIAAYSGCAIALSGALGACGDSNVTPPPAVPPQQPGTLGACESRGTVAVISDPLHQLNVTKEDVIAGAAKTYHIQGQQTHDHLVTLSDQDLASLQHDQGITVTSGVSFGDSVAPHTHQIQVSCAA